MTPTTLAELEQDLGRDLRLVAYPDTPWVPPRTHEGKPVLDVLVVGAGQGGLAVASALLRERITNIEVVDEAAAGDEGIWMHFARMQTLRTPKHIGGPDLGLPGLTFHVWFEAQHGAAAFAAIKYIPKAQWQDYLGWFRRVLALPVRNETRFLGVTPVSGARDGLLRVSLQLRGETEHRLVRKLVLAQGIHSSGRWWMPEAVAALPVALRAHAADAVDFTRMKGRRVAVIGAAASAFDNAATALEHGAARVQMFCRRDELQRVQPYKLLAYAGFLRHFGTLPDATRWRMMKHLLTIREALTRETWERVTRHANFELVTGAALLDARVTEDGSAAQLRTPKGLFEADFVICGTGFETDLALRPELAALAPHAALWADRYPPPPAERDARLGRYPYLDEGMAFTEREPGNAPWLGDVHCFNFGATLSFGPSGSSISAMKFAAPRVVHAIGRDLFQGDIAHHEAQLLAYDTPEFPLVYARDDPAFVAPAA
jgi:cation diffusion facilitator CzcD-associated flavoprotein CzcO